MKFSFSLIKKLVPRVRSKKELLEKLNEHTAETADLGGDVFDVAVPPNRFSDLASHRGMAREISAINGKNFQIRNSKLKIKHSGSVRAPFQVIIQDKNLCSLYAAQYFENIKIGPSPRWMRKILTDCGLRPINNVVDIMNYAMLLTGQPLHAFDYDKLTSYDRRLKMIMVRRAAKGEKLTALDDRIYHLTPEILVIADSEKPIAIAGIRGGKDVEIDKNTKRIIVEAANFDAAAIYRASRRLKLQTDASLRFSHNLSPALVGDGIKSAAELLAGERAKAGPILRAGRENTSPRIIKFDIPRFEKFSGFSLGFREIKEIFERLGFAIKVPAAAGYPPHSFLAEIPPLRRDIEFFEDLAEEVIRLYGYNRFSGVPPRTPLLPSGYEEQIVLKDKARNILTAFGLSEVSNYAFTALRRDYSVELQNPISSDKQYLRASLIPQLISNIELNLKFSKEVRIFEIGRVFAQAGGEIEEREVLGLAFASSKKEDLFLLKGIVNEFLRRVGISDFKMAEVQKSKESPGVDDFHKGGFLEIRSGNSLIGYMGKLKDDAHYGVSAAQMDVAILVALAAGEREYAPISKYPAVMRDISVILKPGASIGEVMQAIAEADKKYIEDVDLVDEYQDSFSFRIVFQSYERTLTDAEVNRKMNAIAQMLVRKFGARIR